MSQATVSLDEVTPLWPKLREMVGKPDKNLPRLLASSKPLAMEGRTLILGFDFPLLKERFDGKKGANESVASALSKLTNTECQVRTVVTDQYTIVTAQAQIDNKDFAALADELGGVVQSRE
jgi:hypothetical protein